MFSKILHFPIAHHHPQAFTYVANRHYACIRAGGKGQGRGKCSPRVLSIKYEFVDPEKDREELA